MRSVEECFRGNSVRVFRLDREGVMRRLRERAEALVAADLDVIEVRLFGSLARGDAGPGSDADLMIVLEECPLPFLERSLRYGRWFEGVGVGCDLLVSTRAERETIGVRSDRFARTVSAEGLTLARR